MPACRELMPLGGAGLAAHGHRSALAAGADPLAKQFVGALRKLDLRHVAAAGEHDLRRIGEGLADVVREARGDEEVVAAPDEKGGRLKALEPGPEALRPVGSLEIDLARG